jgi:mRNA interferase YafQ
MREIERTGQFKRDYKREAKGQHGKTLDADLIAALTLLANDLPMAAKHRDHQMTGNWQHCRNCHVKFDLVLLYKKPDDKTLLLVRLGSHTELGI